MIPEITDLGPLENSDHNALLWSTRVRTWTAKRTQRILDYPKADIAGMKLELQAIDWNKLFGTSPIEDSWSKGPPSNIRYRKLKYDMFQ